MHEHGGQEQARQALTAAFVEIEHRALSPSTISLRQSSLLLPW